VAQLITEFKRYNIAPLQLEAAAAVMEGDLLKEKLAELAVVYKGYEELLSQRYRDADDDLTLAAAKLESSAQYNGAEIWIDGFSGFTPQEYALIARLGLKARRINICLCTDSLGDRDDADGGDVFAAVKDCWRRLERIAAETGLEIEDSVYLGADGLLPGLKDSPELSHLEKNFFAYPHAVYARPTRELALFAAMNVFTEIEAAARDILRLCRDEGMRYRDIAVSPEI
jgi:ATP-dependent helicase/nuclease subunit B